MTGLFRGQARFEPRCTLLKLLLISLRFADVVLETRLFRECPDQPGESGSPMREIHPPLADLIYNFISLVPA